MIETLQGCRIIFIFLIFMSHFTWPGIEEFCFGGECGVSFFFMLSGFVLCHAHGKEVRERKFSSKKFVVRQLTKLYPLHIATMLAAMLIGIKAQVYPEWHSLLLNVLLLQSWIPDPETYFAYNSVSWFLSDIMFFYLMFPFLVNITTKVSKTWLTSIVAAGVAVYACIQTIIPDEEVNNLLYVSPAFRVIDFAAGIILYRVYASDFSRQIIRKIQSGGYAAASITECAAILLMIATYAVYRETEPRWRTASLFWLTMPVFIYLMAIVDKTGGLIADILKSRVIIWLSGLTMAIFMTHKIIITLTKTALTKTGTDLGYLLTCMACVATTLVAAYLTERYFVRYANHYLNKKILNYEQYN